MESTKGYVYILINPSYEGLVKIGKTTREPEGRVKELSAATGVATPFILVYKRLFQDCHTAESNIHKVLTDGGHRVSESREFFRIDITDAINTLLELPDIAASTPTPVEAKKEVSLAESYFLKAEKLYYGSEDDFSDLEEAVEMYEKAGELGYAAAYEKLGGIYIDDYEELDIWNERKRLKAGIRAYRKAAEGGLWWCYDTLAAYDDDNNYAAMKKFFICADKHIDQITDPEEFADKIGRTTWLWIAHRGAENISADLERIFKRWLPRLQQFANETGMYTKKETDYTYKEDINFLEYLKYLQTK